MIGEGERKTGKTRRRRRRGNEGLREAEQRKGEGRAHPTAKRTYRVGGHRTLPTPNAPTGWVALALMQPSCPAHNFTFPIRQIGPQGNMQNPALGVRMATYDYAWGIYYNAS